VSSENVNGQPAQFLPTMAGFPGQLPHVELPHPTGRGRGKRRNALSGITPRILFIIHSGLDSAPVSLAGTRLYAEATEENRTRRTALCRLVVAMEDGTPVALCHGMAYRKDQALRADG